MSKAHTEFVNITLLALSRKGCRAWSNNTGVARSMDNGRIIKYGLTGSADIIGIHHTGKFIACEIKINNDKLRPAQILFRDMILKMNGFYFLIKSEECVLRMVELL